jgi:BA14K-like protein
MDMIMKTIAAALALTIGALSFTTSAEARRWRHHDDHGDAWVAGAVGFGAGALLGSAFASPRYYPYGYSNNYAYGYNNNYYQPAPYAYYQPAPTYVAPAPVVSYRAAAWTPEWYSYCEARYRSFNPSTGYFLGYDGEYHFCR